MHESGVVLLDFRSAIDRNSLTVLRYEKKAVVCVVILYLQKRCTMDPFEFSFFSNFFDHSRMGFHFSTRTAVVERPKIVFQTIG